MTKSTNEVMRELQIRLELTDKELARALHVSHYSVMAWRRSVNSAAWRATPAGAVALAELLVADRERSIKFPQGEY